MSDGQGCICCARDQSECGCDADWTPKEVYELRDKVKQQQALIEQLVGALKFYANAEYGFYPPNGITSIELYDDDGDTAKTALQAAKEAGYDIESN